MMCSRRQAGPHSGHTVALDPANPEIVSPASLPASSTPVASD
jgi:hypothetical protein